VIDLQTGKDAATQVGALLLTASLSTALNAVKGLTREEMVECLVSPLREPSEFLAAFEELEKSARCYCVPSQRHPAWRPKSSSVSPPGAKRGPSSTM
jgi:hypothetical protein